MSEAATIETEEVVETVETTEAPAVRDYEAEARAHGWTPKEEFKGDPGKWVDAETFAKRADEVMPFLKKQNTALKREIDDMKRDFKRASEHFSKAEERAYSRAMADLEAKHDEAVETGDVAAGRKILKEMKDLQAEAPKPETKTDADPAAAQKELDTWIEENDWYVTDANKRTYADLQARKMGLATEYEGGPKAWLDELGRRVTAKFADPKPNPVNGGGNRSANGKGGKTFADLPPEAKVMADKWVKNGLMKSREEYVKSYDWS